MKEKKPEDKLIKNLADAIQKALKSSKIVRKAIDAIEDEGHECVLSFSAAVILNEDCLDSDCENCSKECENEFYDSEEIIFNDKNDDFEFDEEDIEFLKSIKIKVQ
jgi:hypothetical protein